MVSSGHFIDVDESDDTNLVQLFEDHVIPSLFYDLFIKLFIIPMLNL